MILVEYIQKKGISSEDITPAPPSDIFVYDGPITISTGGTYQVNCLSSDSNVPTIRITTKELVRIINSRLWGAGNLIQSTVTGANIEVINCKGYATKPTVSGRARGRFIYAENLANAKIENNYLEHTSGMKFLNYKGNKTASETIKIRFNKAKNIDGRDMNGGDSGPFVCFVQFDKCIGLSGSEIAWNQVINEYGNSLVQDNINMYIGSGTALSPILIHDNFIQGAYNVPGLPGYAGGGIICDRAWDYYTKATTSYVHIYNNQVVGTNNYGVAISGGNHNEAYGNRVICTNLTPSGSPIIGNGDTGIYVYNMYYGGINPATGQPWGDAPADVYNNNKAYNNTVGYVSRKKGYNRTDYYFPVPEEVTQYGNTNISGLITSALEQTEYTNWLSKLSSNNITIGPNF